MNVTEIIKYLNETNSTNDKMKKLKEFKDHQLFKRILEMTYDRVKFTYGVTTKNVEYEQVIDGKYSIEYFLDYLENELNTRNDTGNLAISTVGQILSRMTDEDAELAKKILDRDLKIGVGKTQINKVFKDLITKPAYMRCGVFNIKTAGKIPYPALVQFKADGTYREMFVKDGEVLFTSRSGESYEYPLIAEESKNLKDGYYFGELTVDGVNDRAVGNGLINSGDVPHEKLIYSLWDFVSEQEYKLAKLKDKNNKPFTKYGLRWVQLAENLELLTEKSKYMQRIECYLVDNVDEAIEHCSNWMIAGFEGAILKSQDSVFKDGTNNEQLKMKLKIDADVRIVGFKEGSKGTKREGKIGSIQFITDDKKVQGFASGFSDELLDTISENTDHYIGEVFTVQFNDITKAKNNDYYALSHPRFVEFRNDKTETDTLNRILKSKEMAKSIDNIM